MFFMKTSFVFRRALQALLPATLLLAACGKKDEPAPVPAPDMGKVFVTHAAAAASNQLTAFINEQQVGQLNYGQSTAYSNVTVGTPPIRINNGAQVASTQTLTVAKGQNYSAFIYSPTATIGSTAVLTTTDDLSAPATGAAKVRLVYLGAGAPSPVRLTAPSAIPGAFGADLTPDVAFGAASAFVPLNVGPLNLSVTTTGTTRTQLVVVGDGTGSGTGTKNFESGKIYTIVVRGIEGAGVPTAQRLQAVIIQNN